VSPRPKIPTSLAAKVAQVLRAVKKLKRKGHNDNGDFDYTRATDVFEAVRSHLFALDVLLLPDEGEPEYLPVETNGGEIWTECRLPVTYTFTDGTTSLPPLRCHGIGRTRDEKCLYVAQTGAEKAFLKRVGLMAEKIDDPEYDGKTSREPAGETLDDAAPMRTPRKEQPLAAYQIDAVREALGSTGKTDAELSEVVAARFHAPELAEVKRKHFKELLKWASDGRGTIAAVPKPQAAPDQGALPLRAAGEPIQLKIGSKTVQFEPKNKPYAI
jgi:hypothetical protein